MKFAIFTRHVLLANLVVSVVLWEGASGRLAAQEINWRQDYNEARREAREKGLPLLLNFETESCYWCRRLDDSTFRDPRVCQMVTAHFIPLKIDATKNTYLVETLRIQSYPTLTLAEAEGKIVGTQEGYIEASQLLEQLERVADAHGNPEWMTRDYQDALKAVGQGEISKAGDLLKKIGAADQGTTIKTKAAQLWNEIEQQAAARLARAERQESIGQHDEALATLSELARGFPGTRSAATAEKLARTPPAKGSAVADPRATSARTQLAQAQEDFRTGQYQWCLDRCESLAELYGDMPEGVEASQLIAQIKANPAWLQQAAERLSDRLGLIYLATAEAWLKKGQPQQAAFFLERVMQTFPGSRHAETAQNRLAQLQGQPSTQTNFKKP